MKCSYCQTPMKIATARVKRPVPAGAKDLNLHDEIICWQCPQCGQTSRENLDECYGCKKLVTTSETVANEEGLPLSLISGRYDDGRQFRLRCTNCQECEECKQALNTLDFDIIYYIQADFGIDYDGDFEFPYDIGKGTAYYKYHHKICLEEKKRKAREAEVKQKAREAEVKQKAREAEVKQKEEYARKQAERKREAERNKEEEQEQKSRVLRKMESRRERGVCLVCGKGFWPFDKKSQMTLFLAKIENEVGIYFYTPFRENLRGPCLRGPCHEGCYRLKSRLDSSDPSVRL